VTVTQSFIAAAAGDSMAVVVANQSKPTGGDGTVGIYITDSSNATIRTTANTGTVTTAASVGYQVDYYGSAGQGVSSWTDVKAFAGGTTALTATYRLSFMAPTVAGTYVYKIYAANTTGSQAIASAVQTWTVTVAANTSTAASATYTKMYMNGLSEYTSAIRGKEVDTTQFKPLEADSAVVASAGTAATPTAVAVLSPVVKNSSDTKVASLTGGLVRESVTIVVTGPGLIASYGYSGTTLGTKAKQLTINYRESVVVFADGTAGVGTITTYLGSTVGDAYKLTQAAKTVTFNGPATSFTLTGPTGSVTYSSSDTVTGGASILSFVAKDASLNVVKDATLNTSGESAFYAISSDTSILRALNSATSPALTCSYSTSSAAWLCSGNVVDSGTVTLTVVDSRTLTEGGKVLTATTGAVNKSAALSIVVAGTGYTGTVALDKATYAIGEKAMLTMTSKDSGGRNVANGTSNPFANVNWASASPGAFTADNSTNAAGGTFTDVKTYITGTNTFVNGTDTAMVYMPTTAGTYTLVGTTGNQTTPVTILTFTVTDATKDAADAATDAALEATDAAYAAQDAAQLAAEAADAATAAAEAATAAVEDLATQVASLFNDLQKQITTLANVVAKIAKKVKA